MKYNFDSLEELIIDKIMETLHGETDVETIEWIVNERLERIAQILVDDVTRSELEE